MSLLPYFKEFPQASPQKGRSNFCRCSTNVDLIRTSLYDETDRRQGFLLMKDRQGRLRRFPLIALSIAVIPSENRGFDHAGQLIARAAELKAAAKGKPGSVYLIDRRLSSGHSHQDGADTAAHFSPSPALPS